MKRYLPWLVVGVVTIIGVIQLILLVISPQDSSPEVSFLLGFTAIIIVSLLLPITFTSMGALIATRQPGNRVGWLMLLAGFIWAIPSEIDTILYSSAPASVPLGLWLLLWFYNWSWLLGFLTILLILLNFPDGRPLSSRWDRLNKLALGLLLIWAGSALFWEEIGPTNDSWTVANPIGFIPEIGTAVFALPLYIGMLVLAAGSVASLVIRYRRASPTGRQQIKWLVFAGGCSVLGLILTAIVYAGQPPGAGWILVFLLLSLTAIPIAVAIAILRHRLYDIDIIIRRTLVYGLLTGLIVVIYFVLVLVLQGIVAALGGQQSPIAVVISTLAIAALFNPLRRRVQGFIDRRFYRRRYDAEEALADFSLTVREEVDLEAFPWPY